MARPVRIEVAGLAFPWIAYEYISSSGDDPIHYFVNAKNGATQLEFPKAAEPQKERIYTDASLPYPWICLKSRTKNVNYFVHPVDEKSVWERPKAENLEVPLPPMQNETNLPNLLETKLTTTVKKPPTFNPRNFRPKSGLAQRNSVFERPKDQNLDSGSPMRKETITLPSSSKPRLTDEKQPAFNSKKLKPKKAKLKAEKLNKAKPIKGPFSNLKQKHVAEREKLLEFSQNEHLIVCDTSSLLQFPEVLELLIGNNIVVYIPREVQNELDYRKKDPKFQAIVTRLNRSLRETTTITSESYSAYLILEHSLQNRNGSLILPDNDSKILASALELIDIAKEFVKLHIILLTEDNILAVRTNSYFDNGVLSASAQCMKDAISWKKTGNDSFDGFPRPSLSSEALDQIKINLRNLTMTNGRKSSISPNLMKCLRRPEHSEDFNGRVEAFKFVMGAVVDELLNRFRTSDDYSYKVELSANMKELQTRSDKAVTLREQQHFNRLLLSMERIFLWLDGNHTALEGMGPPAERWKLFSYISFHHPDVLENLSIFAKNPEFTIEPDYFDNLIDVD